MADIRIKDLATTATTTASDDFMAVDGVTNGTRKLSAATPAFLTSVTTPSLTSPASTNLTLGTGTSGAAITVLSADNNVGIGTTGPRAMLEASANAETYLSVARTTASSDGLVIGGITAYTGTASAWTAARIKFVERSGASIPITDIVFETQPVDDTGTLVEKVRIKSSGDVTLSSTTAGASNAGALVVQGGISAGNTGSAASYFGGAVVSSGKFASTVASGSFGVQVESGARIALDGGSNTYIEESSADVITFVTGGTSRLALSTTTATFAGAVSVGTGAAVGGATAGAGGLAFPATAVGVADANTLDDYEEGTWTPTLAPATSGTITVTSPNLCGYTKIGRVVTVNGLIEASAVSSPVGATVDIGNLPFQSNANANQRSAGTVRAFSLTTGALNAIMIITTSTQTAALYIDASLFQATSQIYFQLTYTV